MKFLVFCASVLLASACRPAAAPVSISNAPVSINDVPQRTNAPSKPLPEMNWTSLDGKMTTQALRDLRGKVVVLDFWATYCQPCLEEIPHLNELQNTYGADKLQIVGLHAGGAEDRAKVAQFVERLKIVYPIAAPEDALLDFIFADDDAIPQTAVFDRDGKLVHKFVGFGLKTKNDLDKTIEASVNQ